MRISKFQQQVIVDNTLKFLGQSAKVWLFGSRTDDLKKGGDIDLYIETDLSVKFVSAKLDLLGALQDVFGEQKIDILVRVRSNPMSAIQIIAKDTGILLNP